LKSLYTGRERPFHVSHASPLYATINSAGELTPEYCESSFILNNMDGGTKSRKWDGT